MGKFKDRINQFFNNIKQIKIDKENRQKFIADINLEIADPSSLYNKYRMSVDEDYEVLSCMLSVPENYQLAGTDIMIYNKLKEESLPINRYINNDLNWGEYFLSPEYFHIEDPDDTENVSCTYLATWQYEPILNAYPNFKFELAAFIGINIFILAALIAIPLIILL